MLRSMALPFMVMVWVHVARALSPLMEGSQFRSSLMPAAFLIASWVSLEMVGQTDLASPMFWVSKACFQRRSRTSLMAWASLGPADGAVVVGAGTLAAAAFSMTTVRSCVLLPALLFTVSVYLVSLLGVT